MDDKDKPQLANVNGGSPEWVRRTICCVRWEVENAAKSDQAGLDGVEGDAKNDTAKAKVVLAVSSSSPSQTSPPSQTISLANATHDLPLTPASPVPLPVHHAHVNKHEARSTGTLVSHWAARAGIEMIEVAPTNPSHATSPMQNKFPEDEERSKRGIPHIRAPSGNRGRRLSPQGSLVPGHMGGRGLVERPQSVVAMHAASLMQPTRVVRVLARGEKLDP
jgi:hypothetical protein